MRRAQAISRKGRGDRPGILRDCTPDALHGVKIQSEPYGDIGRPAEMAARLVMKPGPSSNRSERNSLSGKFRPARKA